MRSDCSCITGSGKPCLYTHMSPVKLLAVIATARAAGVTHIVEEGREGGLSALIYALHGFNVTSVEFLPIEEVSQGLQQHSQKQPTQKIALLDGDGSNLVPKVVPSLVKEGAKVAVIFDGEKRFQA